MTGVVDTGAEDHALEEGILEWIPIEPSELSKAGRAFRGPNHSRIPAKGRKRFSAVLPNGLRAHLAGEVCPVKRTLLSGAKLAKAGNRVVCEHRQAYIQNVKTGVKTFLRRDRDVWVLDMWVKRPAGFHRQGK